MQKQQVQQTQPKTVQQTLPKTALEFLDQECQGFKQITLEQNRFIQANSYNVYLFGKVGISRCNTFEVVFNRMKVGAGLGWVDSKLKDSSYIANEPNVVTYRNDGTCRTGTITKQKVGKGYKVCYVVTVTADQDTGKITWAMGGSVLHETTYEPIKDKKIEWVPYIRLCDSGDIAQILFKK